MADRKYYHNNADLGLEDLTQGDPKNPQWPDALFAEYKRLGTSHLPEKDWIAQWKCKKDQHGKPAWWWPDQDGFLLNSTTKPIKTTIHLGPGMLLDRFGGNDTAFFAQYGTPYSMRSLAPCVMNLGYRVYFVKKSFEVEAGPAIPWFDQPGLCLQFKATKFATAEELIKKDYLHELSNEERISLFNGKFGESAIL